MILIYLIQGCVAGISDFIPTIAQSFFRFNDLYFIICILVRFVIQGIIRYLYFYLLVLFFLIIFNFT